MTAARHSAFHRLRVTEVDRITEDAVALTFAVPAELRAAYRFTAGQHVTLRRFAAGEEIRRTYSLCDRAPEGGAGPERLRVGVRLVEGGEFSAYAIKEIAAGDEVEVMTPAGRFGAGRWRALRRGRRRQRHHAGVVDSRDAAGGSAAGAVLPGAQ
jgi:ring-1,2-phenylacetyl-CoA epoxidase subunit PaaE